MAQAYPTALTTNTDCDLCSVAFRQKACLAGNKQSFALQTMTAMQGAIMIVQAYPTATDLVAVMNCLAEDYGEPSAEELMESHVHCAIKLESSALKVPSPDLLLELLAWTQSNQTSHSAVGPHLLTAR